MNVMKIWMAAANREEQERLAALAKTSRAHLYHLASAKRTASAGLARELELASAQLARDGLPALQREDLCPACGRCEYAKQCGSAA